VQLARETGACVLLTIGGPETKCAFAGATANTTVRGRFVENIVNTVVEHGYDGVDIDWEPLQDSDKARFTAFIRDLRRELKSRVSEAMLTAAVAFEFSTGAHKHTTSIVASVIDDLDFIHLMAYGLSGPWDGWLTWHHSALFNAGETLPASTRELPSADMMVNQYAGAGVPYEKMTLGLAFFGERAPRPAASPRLERAGPLPHHVRGRNTDGRGRVARCGYQAGCSWQAW
jgi:chitinase